MGAESATRTRTASFRAGRDPFAGFEERVAGTAIILPKNAAAACALHHIRLVMIRAIGWLLSWAYLWSSLPSQRCSPTAKAKASEVRAHPPVAGKAAVELDFPPPYYRGGQYFASLVADPQPALPSRLRLES